MKGNNDQGGGGGGRGRGRRRPRHHNSTNNNRDHSSNRRRSEHTSSNNNDSSHDDPNDTIRSHNSYHRRSQSPKHARDQNQQGQHHHPPPQSQPIQKQPAHYLHHRKKTFLPEPVPQISNSTLSQILADPIPPLIISFDVENASGTWLGEIWQIGAVCNSASASDSGVATATTDGSGTLDQMESSSSSSSSFLVNMLPVGTIHWGVTKHCTNVRVNEDRRTGRRCLWHTIRKEELTPACIDPATGLHSFLDWIENQRQEYFAATTRVLKDDKIPAAAAAAATDRLTALTQRLPAVILMAHGNLDASNLLNNLAAYDLLPRFESLVAGFVDSQRYLRNGLTAISDRLLPSEMFDAHNALADAQVLYHAVHVKKPSVSQQQHQSFLLPASRLALVEPLQDTFMATQDAIVLTKFKVSKLVQKLPPQHQIDTVRLITALLCVDDVRELDHVVFLDPDKREQRGPLPPPDVFLLQESSQMNASICSMDVINTYEPSNTTLLAFDVQFTESTGVRSHIHRICAMELGNEEEGNDSDNKHNSLLFDLTCVPPDEVDQLLSSPSVPSGTKSHTTTRDLLEQFLSWLTDTKKHNNNNHIVLCAYGPRQRKWPGLLNHMSYHGLETDFSGIVVGVCDLASAMTSCPAAPLVAPAAAASAVASSFSSTSNSNNNNINNNHGSHISNGKNVNDFKAHDKAHGSFCPRDKHGVPILHRANEVCQSNQTIAREIIRRHRQSVDAAIDILPLLPCTITYRSAYANAQILLDQSLGADIMAGMQFDGYGQAYKGHRLPRMAGYTSSYP